MKPARIHRVPVSSTRLDEKGRTANVNAFEPNYRNSDRPRTRCLRCWRFYGSHRTPGTELEGFD